MATINYDNKVAININPNIPEINKVTDSNMNLIKQVGNQILTTMGVYTDNWSSSATYEADDIAIYDNRIFKNLTGVNTATTPDQDTTNWEETTIADLVGGGAEIPIQSTAPHNPQEDDLWIDTSEETPIPNDVYSSSEVQTNKIWIDGKPIYRKVTTLVPDATDKKYASGISNVDNMVNMYGIYKQVETSKVEMKPIPYGTPSYTYGITFSYLALTDEIRVQLGSAATLNYTLYVIMEYTKTTD